jgi:hypothetical protein
MSRVSGKSSRAKRNKKRIGGKGTTGKFAEHEFWDEQDQKAKPITISSARLRREHKRAKAKKVRERKEPKTKPTVTKAKARVSIMAQPLSARGDYAKGTEMKVPSTVIFWVEYYLDHERLIIAFRGSGKYYTYYNVPMSVYQAFKLAPSKGRYFNKYVKGKYNYLEGAHRP